MKKALILLLAFLFFSMCKKDEKNKPSPGGEGVPQNPNNYSVITENIKPGVFVTLESTGPITIDTCTIKLGPKQVFLSKVDSNHYAFLAPILNPGIHELNLTKVNASKNLNVTISNYTPITTPDETISLAINDFDKITKLLSTNFLPFSKIDLMHQLTEQLGDAIQSCTDQEKLLLAYQLDNMDLDFSFKQNKDIDTSYIVSKKNGGLNKISGEEDEIAYLSLATLLDAERVKLKAIIASRAVVVTGATLLIIRNQYTFASFIASIMVYLSHTNAAAKKFNQGFSSSFMATDLSEKTGIDIKPIEVLDNQSTFLKIYVKFRTAIRADENGSNNTISNSIKASYELEKKDLLIKSTFDKLNDRFHGFFNKIKASYSPFISPVLDVAKEKSVEGLDEFISVTNVSNSDISVAAVSDGTPGLEVKFTNPHKNITTETDFTFQLAYSQAALNNKVNLVQHAKFKPTHKPIITTALVSTITSTSALTGGIITNSGGSNIIDKGVCVNTEPNPTLIHKTYPAGFGSTSFVSNLSDLTPDKTYYVRAYATNSLGTAYGNDVQFKTLVSALSISYWKGYYRAESWLAINHCPEKQYPDWDVPSCSAPMFVTIYDKEGVISGDYTMMFGKGSIMGKKINSTTLSIDFTGNHITTAPISVSYGESIGSKMSGQTPAVYINGSLYQSAVTFECVRIR